LGFLVAPWRSKTERKLKGLMQPKISFRTPKAQDGRWGVGFGMAKTTAGHADSIRKGKSFRRRERME